jgi:hypothetical protein
MVSHPSYAFVFRDQYREKLGNDLAEPLLASPARGTLMKILACAHSRAVSSIWTQWLRARDSGLRAIAVSAVHGRAISCSRTMNVAGVGG